MGLTKTQRLMFSVVACTIFFIYAINLLGLSVEFRRFGAAFGRKIFPSKLNSTMLAQNRTPMAENRRRVVLAYTTLYGGNNWLQPSKTCSQVNPCSMDTFEVTHDKKRLNESEFIVFHARDMPGLDHLKMLLKSRHPSQWWIYFLGESPNATPNTQPLNGLFNLTWTYRSDSDLLMPYGGYVELSNGTANSNVSVRDFSKGKSKLVAWMVTNCGPKLRKEFVHELQKYVQVDVYGGCSPKFGESRDCPRRERATCTSVLSQYKFYLAFENALCEDYITEKYWRRLGEDLNVVVVVLGGANYTKLAIPGSYINVMDFKTVKQLAEYLQYLDKNSTAYNEYFKWRQKYRVERPPLFPCQFCKLFNKPNPPQRKVYSNLSDFWVTQGKCNQKDAIVRNMFQS